MLVNVKKEKDKMVGDITAKGVQIEMLKETAKKDTKKAAYLKK
jgi:hypothetical protein